MSILSEPRKPDCDVCDWATAYHYAYGMNLCAADLDVANKVAETERERIIKLIEDERVEPSPNNPMANYDRLVIEGVKEQLILLIKGENK